MVRFLSSHQSSNRVRCLALIGAMLASIVVAPSLEARDDLATPFASEFALASFELELTLSTTEVEVGELRPGDEVIVPEAVVVSVTGSGPVAWSLTCRVEPGSGHTAGLEIAQIAFSEAGAASWQPFPITPTPCYGDAFGDLAVAYDYRLTVPEDTTPGAIELLITYAVTSLD